MPPESRNPSGRLPIDFVTARRAAVRHSDVKKKAETAFKHPELFSHVWVLSSSFSPGKQKEYVDSIRLKEIAPALNKNFKALYFTQGGPADIAYKNCQEALGYLKDAGIKYHYLENAQAGHSWTTWRADLQVLAPTLFR